MMMMNNRWKVFGVLYLVVGIWTYGNAYTEAVERRCSDSCAIESVFSGVGWPLYFSRRLQR